MILCVCVKNPICAPKSKHAIANVSQHDGAKWGGGGRVNMFFCHYLQAPKDTTTYHFFFE